MRFKYIHTHTHIYMYMYMYIYVIRDFLDCPVAKTLCSQWRGPGFDPSSGNWMAQAEAKDPTCHNKDQRSWIPH